MSTIHFKTKEAGYIIARRKQKQCLVFEETISAALGNVSNYFHKSWNHAAAHIETAWILSNYISAFN